MFTYLYPFLARPVLTSRSAVYLMTVSLMLQAKWFQEFQNFLKEGLTVDAENAEPLFKLLRFNSTFSGNNMISLDDYIAKMKPTQEKIYFVVG